MHNLEKLHSELSEIREKNKGEKTLESVKEEIACYESFIKEFFSKTGEGKHVATLFESVDDSLTIESVDLYKVKDVYSEYVSGMMNFMDDIIAASNLNESEALSGLEEKFGKAKVNDHQFIENLCTKMVQKETLPITEATGNISFLVDFVPEMKVVGDYCESMTAKVGPRTNDLSTGSLNMLYESVSHYCYYMINEALNAYENINVATEGENVNSKEEFKLF